MPSLIKVVEEVCSYIPPTVISNLSIVHGDFCFSNLFYDHRGGLIKMIDPRGSDKEVSLSLLGDSRYDLAKLNHSIIGRYDHIISGHFICHVNSALNFDLTVYDDDLLSNIQGLFLNSPIFSDMRSNHLTILAITSLLFFSMLPLHSDNPTRQMALLANALSLSEKVIR
jgi:hypothetical protein